jgi:hypothetical protein
VLSPAPCSLTLCPPSALCALTGTERE